MTHRLIWTNTAIHDLESVRDDIVEHNPQAAREVGQVILAAVAKLAEFPAIGRMGRVPNTRELVVPGLPFILPYTVDNNRVVILAVIHGARKWPVTFINK